MLNGDSGTSNYIASATTCQQKDRSTLRLHSAIPVKRWSVKNTTRDDQHIMNNVAGVFFRKRNIANGTRVFLQDSRELVGYNGKSIVPVPPKLCFGKLELISPVRRHVWR